MTDENNHTAAQTPGLWSTDLFIPQYNSGEFGAWKISPGGKLVHDWGYYSGVSLVEMQPYLSRKASSPADAQEDRWDIWMSLTPHEIESQELAARYAFGHTVIMGLGMGWIAANVALHPRVTRVTIIERDPEVVELFTMAGAFDSLPEAARKKLSIVQADAMQWHPAATDRVDFLYADIWLHLVEPDTLQQTRQMQANVQADTIYFWGQEIAINSAARLAMAERTHLSEEAMRIALTDVLQLPLLIPDDRNYLYMINRVIQNRLARGLTNDFNLQA